MSWSLIYGGVAVASFWLGHSSLKSNLREQGRADQARAGAGNFLQIWDTLSQAPPADWEHIWQEAPTPGHREILLGAWMERAPGEVLSFLRRRPPLSLLNQNGLERNALLAWGKQDPVAAYAFACRHQAEYGSADAILQETLGRDVELGLRLIGESSDRDSLIHGDLTWVAADPPGICGRLAVMKAGICQDHYLKEAARIWAGSDLGAARAFVLSLPGPRADIALSGILGVMSPAQAADLLMQSGHGGTRPKAVHELMNVWGREDAAAAVKWAVEELPPAALSGAMMALASNVLPYPQYASDEAMPELLGQLSPAAWKVLAKGPAGLSGLLPRVLPHAPDWIVADLAWDWLKQEAKPLTDPANHPPWFSQLTPERISKLMQIQTVLSGRDY